MSPTKIILSLSLAANVALVFVYLRPKSTDASARSDATTSATIKKSPSVAPESEVAAALRADPEFAEAIKSGDPHRLREALVKAGFPDSYVRDMVTFFTGNSVRPENLALLRLQAEKPFWKTSLSEEGLALQKMLRDRDAKNNEIAKEVFGGKIPPHPLEALNQQRRYRFLAADKIEAVVRVDADFADLEAANRNANTPESRDKAREVQAEKRAALAKVLTPDELALYDFNVSPTAMTMRSQLALFQPTEEEFRALFAIRQPFDEKYSGFTGVMDRATMQQRTADQQAVNDQARALLGDARYAEYTRTQDYGYRAAVEIASHYNLPAANATETYNLQQSMTARMQEISRTTGADRTAAATQMSGLAAEANAQLVKLLGAAGADAYKKTGGFWLRVLERPPAPSAPRGTGG